MSRGTEVTLTGTWFRADTLPYDITMLRRLFARQNRHYETFLAWREQGQDRTERPFVRGSFVTRQKAPVPGAREGGFKVTVFVPYVSNHGTLSRPAVARAKQVLRWFLQDVTCRPPVLAFDTEVSLEDVR